MKHVVMFSGGIGSYAAAKRVAADGWRYEAPMCEAPFVAKWQMLASLAAVGIAPPRMYAEGFGHNNCAGECVKEGVGHWAKLYRQRPTNYLHAEAEEESMRTMLGKDVAILTETVKGVDRNLTLRELRRRIECGAQIDMFAVGGCGCFLEAEEEAV